MNPGELVSIEKSKSPDRGVFVFSVDTELAWGYFDKFNPHKFSADRERETIHRVLELMEKYSIRSTWCVVGAMFNKEFEGSHLEMVVKDWQKLYPDFTRLLLTDSKLVYGEDILNALQANSIGHEIGFHGYSHRFFRESEMSLETARFEIVEWIRVAEMRGIAPGSITFPRDRAGYLDLFKHYGFRCYRGDTMYPAAYRLPFVGRFFRRFAYTLSTVVEPCLFNQPEDTHPLVCIPASQWLFGYNRWIENQLDLAGKETLRLIPLSKAIHRAASERKMIHVFAHPYEFRAKADFSKLEYIFEHVAQEVQAGRMRVLTMGELADWWEN